MRVASVTMFVLVRAVTEEKYELRASPSLLSNSRFQFETRGQFFIRSHNETLIVAAVRLQFRLFGSSPARITQDRPGIAVIAGWYVVRRIPSRLQRLVLA